MSPKLPTDHAARAARSALALDGVSVGDALGQACFLPTFRRAFALHPRTVPGGPWSWTDDTAMALSVHDVLMHAGRIDQDDLAARFAQRFRSDPGRGYGPGALRLLAQLSEGVSWQAAAPRIFPGGSFGNGSAMRVGPLAGYFAGDDYPAVARQAELSAQVTHAHPEGIAGAIAAAVAGAYAWEHRAARAERGTRRGLVQAVAAFTPPGAVRRGLEAAAALDLDTPVEVAAQLLGNGSEISCQDTVPFCVWIAARHVDDYEAALLATVSADGDIDTNCAIVGAIVSLAVGRDGIPAEWLRAREALGEA